MPIDPNIALHVNTGQNSFDPLEQFAKIQSIRNLIGQRPIQEAQLEKIRLDNEQTKLENEGLPAKQAAAAEAAKLAQRKADLEAEDKDLDLGIKKAGRLASLAGTIKDDASKDYAIGQAIREGVLDKEHGVPLLMHTYESIKPTLGQFTEQAMTATQQADERRKKIKDQLDAFEFKQKELLAPGILEKNQAEAAEAKKKLAGTATEQILAQNKFNQELKDFDEKVRHNKADEVETARFHNQSFEGVTLTPEAKTKMAEMFATTGALPSLGMGKAASQQRSDIINQAAKDFPQVDFATNKAAFQANQGSLRNLQKQQDAIEGFENTAGKNLDQFLNTAKRVVDTGSPLINKPLRSIGKEAFGSENQAAFDTARQVAVTEIAKVLNNPSGSAAVSDSNRKEIQDLIGPNASLKQIYRAAEILRQDMSNRRDSGREQIKAIQSRISGKEEQPPAGKVKVWDQASQSFK